VLAGYSSNNHEKAKNKPKQISILWITTSGEVLATYMWNNIILFSAILKQNSAIIVIQ
jgi:hypothetical protein